MNGRSPVTNSPISKNNTNLTVPAVSGLPAVVVNYSRDAVMIFCEGLSEVLEMYYSLGVHHVNVAVGLGGQQLTIECTIHRKVDRRINRVYYYLYPLGSSQHLLRERYKEFRGAAKRYAKTPMPIVVYSIMPKKTA